MHVRLILLAAIMALASCGPTDQAVSPPTDVHTENVAAVDGPAEVPQELRDRDRIAIPVGIDDSATSSWLPQMKKLRHLDIYCQLGDGTVSPWELGQYITRTEDGRIIFPAILTDEFIQEIMQIETLETIAIWYGSLTDDQRAVLRDGLPNCKVWENVNKL